MRRSLKRLLFVAAAAMSAMLLLSGPAAAAAVNDGFVASTDNGCGTVNFIDYGPGAPGGGNNDDYTVIHDYCGDTHGVRAFAWIDGFYLGTRYNGNGLAGAAVVWDPFGNVAPGEFIELLVCLVDGAGDETGDRCGYASRTSADG